jgi:ABC-type amino acid transport system permease subunit
MLLKRHKIIAGILTTIAVTTVGLVSSLVIGLVCVAIRDCWPQSGLVFGTVLAIFVAIWSCYWLSEGRDNYLWFKRNIR